MEVVKGNHDTFLFIGFSCHFKIVDVVMSEQAGGHSSKSVILLIWADDALSCIVSVCLILFFIIGYLLFHAVVWWDFWFCDSSSFVW